MSWSIGYDSTWARDIGYGVPAYCDHPDCGKTIDRGLGYVCGSQPRGGDRGCGLYFCGDHQKGGAQLCARCVELNERLERTNGADCAFSPFLPTRDHPDWVKHKLSDESWAKWRAENTDEVSSLTLGYPDL